jgi:threonine dehydrogenase-like Zn-dependent dehydrogenase
VKSIVIVDLNAARLEIAREIAKETGGIAVTNLDEYNDATGFDAVIDAVGAETTRQASVSAVRPGGKVVFTGLHEAESSLPVNNMIRQEIVAQGAFAYSNEDFATALLWIEQGRVDLSPWIVTAPLSEGSACFERLISGPGKVAKIILCS